MNFLSTIQYGNNKTLALTDAFLYATLDPGGVAAINANTKTDKTGWTVGAVTPAPSDFIILEAGEEYMEVTEMLNLIYALHKRWRPRLIGVERMMYLQQYFYAAMQQRGKILSLHTLAHKGRSKPERIKAVLPYLKQTYFLEPTVKLVQAAFTRWHEKLLHGDDWIDSFAYFFDVANAPSLNDLMQQKRERQGWVASLMGSDDALRNISTVGSLEDTRSLLQRLDKASRAEAIATLKTYKKGGSFNEEYTEAFYDTG